MATQKRASRTTRGGVQKKTTKAPVQNRRRATLKAATPASGRKRAPATASATPAPRKRVGVIKRAIKRGLSELTKAGA